jgi:hypothetical protein
MAQSFSEKDPQEIVYLTFDFSRLTSTIQTATLTVQRLIGPYDSSPQTMIVGSAVIAKGVVKQRVQNGLANTDYRIRCEAVTADGQRYVLDGILPVRSV